MGHERRKDPPPCPAARTGRETAAAAASVGAVAEFFAQVISRDVGALAARPVTLRLLLRTFAPSGGLPQSRSELYDKGRRLLAAEESESRKAARRTGKLDPAQRLAVAGRIAHTLIFSNRSAVWTNADSGDVPPSDITIADLAGGTEAIGGVRVPVSEAEIREVLDTGLFVSRGASRIGFSHQTYAEYLAAWYVAAHKLKWPEVASLLVHPGDREERIVPQLRETAARLAERGNGILQEIIARDPDVLLSADLTIP